MPRFCRTAALRFHPCHPHAHTLAHALRTNDAHAVREAWRLGVPADLIVFVQRGARTWYAMTWAGYALTRHALSPDTLKALLDAGVPDDVPSETLHAVECSGLSAMHRLLEPLPERPLPAIVLRHKHCDKLLPVCLNAYEAWWEPYPRQERSREKAWWWSHLVLKKTLAPSTHSLIEILLLRLTERPQAATSALQGFAYEVWVRWALKHTAHALAFLQTLPSSARALLLQRSFFYAIWKDLSRTKRAQWLTVFEQRPDLLEGLDPRMVRLLVQHDDRKTLARLLALPVSRHPLRIALAGLQGFWLYAWGKENRAVLRKKDPLVLFQHIQSVMSHLTSSLSEPEKVRLWWRVWHRLPEPPGITALTQWTHTFELACTTPTLATTLNALPLHALLLLRSNVEWLSSSVPREAIPDLLSAWYTIWTTLTQVIHQQTGGSGTRAFSKESLWLQDIARLPVLSCLRQPLEATMLRRALSEGKSPPQDQVSPRKRL